jgi:hypothetical protein
MRTPRPLNFSRSPILTPDPQTPNFHGIISFADPHPLTQIESYRYKNKGGGGGNPRRSWPTISHSPYTLPSAVCRKSFICLPAVAGHSYENTGGSIGISSQKSSSITRSVIPFWNSPIRPSRKNRSFHFKHLREPILQPPLFSNSCRNGGYPLDVPIGTPLHLWRGDPDPVGTFKPSNMQTILQAYLAARRASR